MVNILYIESLYVALRIACRCQNARPATELVLESAAPIEVEDVVPDPIIVTK